MHLKEYLLKNKIKDTALAKKLGITRVYVYKLKTKKSLPSPKLAKEIELLTEGLVTAPEMLYPEGWKTILERSKSSK